MQYFILILLVVPFYSNEEAPSSVQVEDGRIGIGLFFPGESGGRKYISISDHRSKLFVIVQNKMNHRMVFWRGLAYAGYKNVRFKAVDEGGGTRWLKIVDRPPGSELDMSAVLEPMGYLVLEILVASDEWKSFRTLPMGKMQISAEYSSLMEKQQSEGWTGIAVSPTYDVIIVK